jgi:transcriptional regulator with XRE-family HTH domain
MFTFWQVIVVERGGVETRIRETRAERGWTVRRLADESGVDKNTISGAERGLRKPNPITMHKLAEALGVEVGDLFPKVRSTPPLEDAPSLEELHAAAGCETDWLVKPESQWESAWSNDQSPRHALRIVREMTAEFGALKPLMAEQERDLPIMRRAINGWYRQAWLREFTGLQAAHNCCVATGLIRPEETLNDAAAKLGEAPGKPLEGLLAAS